MLTVLANYREDRGRDLAIRLDEFTFETPLAFLISCIVYISRCGFHRKYAGGGRDQRGECLFYLEQYRENPCINVHSRTALVASERVRAGSSTLKVSRG